MATGEEMRRRFAVEMEREGLKPADIVRWQTCQANTVYRILRGETTNPTIDKLAKIAAALHRPVEYFWNGSVPWYKTNDESLLEICNRWAELSDDMKGWLKVTMRTLEVRE